jgi:predicted nucleic acid-binding protein
MERLMKYLLDTNIIIEGLLGGKKGEDVKNLFKKVDIFLMAITDLSLPFNWHHLIQV